MWSSHSPVSKNLELQPTVIWSGFNPSEKWWSSSVGIFKNFPTYGKYWKVIKFHGSKPIIILGQTYVSYLQMALWDIGLSWISESNTFLQGAGWHSAPKHHLLKMPMICAKHLIMIRIPLRLGNSLIIVLIHIGLALFPSQFWPWAFSLGISSYRWHHKTSPSVGWKAGNYSSAKPETVQNSLKNTPNFPVPGPVAVGGCRDHRNLWTVSSLWSWQGQNSRPKMTPWKNTRNDYHFCSLDKN